jgi:hypothetical protein
MLEIVPSTNNKTAIVTLAVGEAYEKPWRKYALPSWLKYCKKYGIGLYVQNVNLDGAINPKKKQWQKLLLGVEIEKLHRGIEAICYLDTDILINSHAPNIFNYHKKGTVGLVSKFSNLPEELPFYEINSSILNIPLTLHYLWILNNYMSIKL